MHTPDDRQPWDRHPGEASKAFHAFTHYRNAGSQRSIDKAFHQHMAVCVQQQIPSAKRAGKLWWNWARDNEWVSRCEFWDADVDRQLRAKVVKDQQDARERHGRLAQGALMALSTPVRATLDALQDPAVLATLLASAKSDAASFLRVIALIARAAHAIPALVNVERMALGLTSESLEIHDQREHSPGDRIPEDPITTELAIALLDRLAGPGAGSAVGAGVPGEPGSVAHSAAS